MLLIVAIVGTTVAPWQLFFQQSNIVDKRITTRWINYERADTVIGSFVVVVGAALLMVDDGVRLQRHALPRPLHERARGRETGSSTPSGTSPASSSPLILLNASIIGAGAVTLATSYAFGDLFGIRHSLHRPPREAKFFYGSYTAIVVLAAAIVLIPGAPLGVITLAVQALAGVLLPSASVFLLLLCNDKEVLGPWVNKPWLNVLATLITGVLFMLSAILVVTTVFPVDQRHPAARRPVRAARRGLRRLRRAHVPAGGRRRRRRPSGGPGGRPGRCRRSPCSASRPGRGHGASSCT